MSIGRIGAGNKLYHLSEMNDPIEGYYLEGQEVKRVGKLAADLGITELPDRQTILNILDGLKPDGSGPLAERATKNLGFDFALSVGKDVSILHALGNENVRTQTMAAIDAAKTAAIGYIEQNAIGARRGTAGVDRVAGDGLIGFSISHTVSRNLDPQLHVHVIVANVTRGPDDRFTALDGRPLYQHARTAGFIFQAELRAELTERLGYFWGDVEKGVAPIIGVNRNAVREFSTRSNEIREALDRNGMHSSEAARIATLTTRPPKGYEPDEFTLRSQWITRAEPWLESLARLPKEVRTPQLHVTDAELATTVTHEHATFDRRTIVQAIATAAKDGAHLHTIDNRIDEFLHSGSAVQLTPELWTTPEMLALEQRTVDAATSMQKRAVGLVQLNVVDDVIAARPSLGNDQRNVIEQVAMNGDGVSIISGWAGAGKTYTADAIRSAYERSGYTVLGAAPSARAAAELQAGAGINSTTIERLLIDLDRGKQKLDASSVVIVDEAAMVGTRKLASLLEQTTGAGSKTILIGDVKQLPSVEAGGLFSALSTRLGLLELNENRRQRDPAERVAVLDLRNGQIEQAMERLQRNGNVITSHNAEDLRTGLVADWYTAKQSGSDVLMLAPRRNLVDDLNKRARALLVADGSIGDPLLRTDTADYSIGDSIVALRNDRNIGIRNGDRATISALTNDGLIVQRTDSTQLTIPLSYLEAGHLTHGYATTIHKAQGVTVDQVLVLGDDTYAHEHGYTALTRGRETNRVYLVAPETPTATREHLADNFLPPELNAVDAFIKSLHHSSAKTAAIDHAPHIPEITH